jgi:3alpha(or 20beta)-hydroxysteroid dehydrogenase
MLRDPAIVASGALDMLLPRIPLGRTVEASEVADLVAFLASDESGYCTGTQFVIDGGMIAGTFFPTG